MTGRAVNGTLRSLTWTRTTLYHTLIFVPELDVLANLVNSDMARRESCLQMLQIPEVPILSHLRSIVSEIPGLGAMAQLIGSRCVIC